MELKKNYSIPNYSEKKRGDIRRKNIGQIENKQQDDRVKSNQS